MQSYSVEFIYLFYNLFNITLRSYPLVKVAYWCHFFLFLRDTRLDRADEKTMIYQMAHCVLFFFWQRDPTEYWDEGPAWIFWGREREKKSVKFLGASVLPICHLLYRAECSDGRYRIAACRAVIWCVSGNYWRLWQQSNIHSKVAIAAFI